VPPSLESTSRARLVQVYLATKHRFEQVQRLMNALFIGGWLGVMGRETLALLDARFYSTHPDTVGDRALKYADAAHIRSGLNEWEISALTTHFPPEGRLVITGAGAGREILGALDLGFDPVGFEPHPGLREAGNAVLVAEGHPDVLRDCDRDRFPAEVASADGVVVGWTSYSHIPGADRRIAFLRDARRVLTAGSPILLSFWMLPGKERYLRAVRSAARLGRWLTRGETVELGDVLSPLFVHCFTEEQIRYECAAAGLAIEAFHTVPYPHVIARSSNSIPVSA
jgi:hypothetical protein